MGFLRGTICSKMNNSKIPERCVLKLSLIESVGTNKAIKLIGKLEINDPQSFPINYELEYDDNDLKNTDSVYYLNVLIKKDRVNFYSNETKSASQTLCGNEYGDLISCNGRIRRYLDVYLSTLNLK